jgi:hypothetical protein
MGSVILILGEPNMPISLHAAIIPTWLQILGAGKGWLDKAAASGIDEAELVESRLIENMLPFKYQVKSMAVHSQGAIEGVRKGSFSPDLTEAPTTLAGLQERIDGAISFLESVPADEMEGYVGSEMFFTFGERKIPFTGEVFLMTFSQPQFFFHASIAYGLLRARGIEIGKRDYLGQLRIAN